MLFFDLTKAWKLISVVVVDDDDGFYLLLFFYFWKPSNSYAKIHGMMGRNMFGVSF